MAKFQKRTVVVVQPRVDERLVSDSGTMGVVGDSVGANGRERTQAEKPWPGRFGWDYPFDVPKPAR